jgi:hypothetical protein
MRRIRGEQKSLEKKYLKEQAMRRKFYNEVRTLAGWLAGWLTGWLTGWLMQRYHWAPRVGRRPAPT